MSSLCGTMEMMTMPVTFQLVPSVYEGKLFLKGKPRIRADCVMNFYVMCDTAFFTNLCGDGFYDNPGQIYQALKEHGITRLRYFCSPQHYRVQARLARSYGTFVKVREGLRYNGAETVECLLILDGDDHQGE